MNWQCASYSFDVKMPIVMGILNVTPDSFSDGGEHNTHDAAIAHAKSMIEQGAKVIDVGGESTRPGFHPVDADEEARRVLPVVRALAQKGAIVSIDTRHVEVAKAAVRVGASIVNDVTGFTDPKMVEFSLYAKIERHFLAKMESEDDAIITDTHKVIYTLNSLCIEMDARYDLLRKAEVRHVKEYNDKFRHRKLNPQKGHRFLPYIIVVIDEFADLIMTAGREVETPIARIAQLARAVGIHLVIATQRPTTNIITGTIKANFPARIAFRVSAMMDSRTILDRPGANRLIGKGDMLFLQGADPVRVQCAFIDTPEVEEITKFIARQQGYPTPFFLPEYVSEDSGSEVGDIDMGRLDPLFEDAARLVVIHQQGSTSLIQRKFAIGYNRAGRIMDQLEKAGIVGPTQGSKARDVLCIDDNDLEMRLNNLQ